MPTGYFQNLILVLSIFVKRLSNKKYPKISCGAGILPAHDIRRDQMPTQDWIA